MQANAQAQQWHVTQWGLWAWIETILKLIAVCAGFLAFFASLSAPGFTLRSNPHLAAIVVLGLGTLLALVMVPLRFQQKEIISMIYRVLHALGHLGLLFALFRVVDVKGLALAFGMFWAAGQLFKLQFFRTTGYTEFGLTKDGIMRWGIGYFALYLLFAVLMLL